MWTSYNIMLRENVGFFDNQDKVVGKLLLPEGFSFLNEG